MGLLTQHSQYLAKYLIPCVTAFIITVFIIYLLKPLAIRLKLVDVPGGRKMHQGEVPLTGGIGMFLGFIFALLTLDISLADYRSFIAASGLLVFIGILDDLHELSTKSRFIAQIIAASLMVIWGHVVLKSFGNICFFGNVDLGNMAIPMTIFAVVGVINAINMTDGVDGLAGSLVLVQLMLLGFLSFVAGPHFDTAILMVLSVSLFGFLLFNLPLRQRFKSTAFMGDSGSMFLGFALVWFLIHLSQEHPVAKPVTMLWIMAIPLFDTMRLLWQRTRQSRSPFKSARDHLHHILMDLGYTPIQIILLLGFANLSLGIIGIVAGMLSIPEGIMFLSILLLFVFYCRTLKHLESRVISFKDLQFVEGGPGL
jgi:UDP-GlcNAc:undecaprenyl-phosphate GlcNAc-1-phosphate transferase